MCVRARTHQGREEISDTHAPANPKAIPVCPHRGNKTRISKSLEDETNTTGPSESVSCLGSRLCRFRRDETIPPDIAYTKHEFHRTGFLVPALSRCALTGRYRASPGRMLTERASCHGMDPLVSSQNDGGGASELPVSLLSFKPFPSTPTSSSNSCGLSARSASSISSSSSSSFSASSSVSPLKICARRRTVG